MYERGSRKRKWRQKFEAGKEEGKMNAQRREREREESSVKEDKSKVQRRVVRQVKNDARLDICCHSIVFSPY